MKNKSNKYKLGTAEQIRQKYLRPFCDNNTARCFKWISITLLDKATNLILRRRRTCRTSSIQKQTSSVRKTKGEKNQWNKWRRMPIQCTFQTVTPLVWWWEEKFWRVFHNNGIYNDDDDACISLQGHSDAAKGEVSNSAEGKGRYTEKQLSDGKRCSTTGTARKWLH